MFRFKTSSAAWLAAALLLIILLVPLLALAQVQSRPLRFCDVCEGYTVSKRGDDLLIRCPGRADPWLTIRACKNPVVRRRGPDLTITCNG